VRLVAAPPARRARRAQVRRRHGNSARHAVAPVPRSPSALHGSAPNLVARPARSPAFEQRRTQRCSHGPVPELVRVLVPARTCLRPCAIRPPVERNVRTSHPPLRTHRPRQRQRQKQQHGELAHGHDPQTQSELSATQVCTQTRNPTPGSLS
jgi:hypothetical protein